MNIIGPDSLVFGVDDVAACVQYLTDYGLAPRGITAAGGCFEALDGTAIVIRRKDDPSLPPPMDTASMLRKTVYGVADAATLAAVAAELAKDREVRELPDGSIETVDDMGFVLGFQITIRRPFSRPAEAVNAPGAPVQRPANVVAVDENAVIDPRTLSHVVYFVPDVATAEAFYVERLGFRCTDRFIGAGPFLQPGGSLDHHSLFLIQTLPPGGAHRVDAGRESFREQGLPIVLGPRTAQVRFELVLVFQQSVGLPCGIRCGHGPARPLLGGA